VRPQPSIAPLAGREGQVARAAGEADAFGFQVAARAAYPALTDHRLYWETIATVLANRSKVILDADPTRHRHLIIPNLPIPVLDAASVLRSATSAGPKRGTVP